MSYSSRSSPIQPKPPNIQSRVNTDTSDIKKSNKECGTSTRVIQLVSRSGDTKPGDYPWMAAIYDQENAAVGIEFICGGSVISNKHILTGNVLNQGFSKYGPRVISGP